MKQTAPAKNKTSKDESLGRPIESCVNNGYLDAKTALGLARQRMAFQVL